jgi:hypothetical protein
MLISGSLHRAAAPHPPLRTASFRMLAPEALVTPDPTMLLAARGGLAATADELAGSLFGASLFPWLAMYRHRASIASLSHALLKGLRSILCPGFTG